MPTPRYYPSASSYNNWLVVAGGYHGSSLCVVEILDVGNQQWSTGPSLPTPWESMKSSTVGDTWYPVGGGGDKGWSALCVCCIFEDSCCTFCITQHYNMEAVAVSPLYLVLPTEYWRISTGCWWLGREASV